MVPIQRFTETTWGTMDFVRRMEEGGARGSGRQSSTQILSIDLPRKPEPDKRYLTHAQVADLAAECGEHDALVLVLAYCGLRWGEATALKWCDVDFDRARIEVRASVERVNGVHRMGPTKTHETR
jgi:integrase